MSLTQILAIPLNSLMMTCYRMMEHYLVTILVFTLLTKIILFPVSLWTHKNGITMIRLMPELNQLKIKYYGDKDTIAEETQMLYKRHGYHPLVSTAPMFIQLALLVGVIGAVQVLLAGTESVLSVPPAQAGGIMLLMPLAAGGAALLLGIAQNRLNPLQREQARIGQWITNGISVGISLFLGAFVPVGVGVYWIASNLLTIGQQLVLNAVMPASKYVDYESLERSKQELARIESLSPHVSREDKQREKADYKRFFSVANKHLVFYSESSGFYKYFADIIDYLLKYSNVSIHYITSDPRDTIFQKAQQEPRIKPYYIGEKRLITLMMKMDADMVVMTMPDLDNFHIKRSYVRKDIEYVYIFHGVISGMRTLRPNALDHYDTLLTPGNYMDKEIREIEKINGIPEKKLIPCGYGVVDNMAVAYEAMEKKEHQIPHVLIAPSWQEQNILESCLYPLASALLENGYDVTVRPHPQYLKRFPLKFEQIRLECGAFSGEHFRFETDFSSNDTVFTAELIVTDWSGIGYEYAFATKKPVLFINTPMKIVNPQLADQKDSVDLKIRNLVGIALKPDEVETQAKQVSRNLIENTNQYALTIEEMRQKYIYHFGESGKYGARYILQSLQARSSKTLK